MKIKKQVSFLILGLSLLLFTSCNNEEKLELDYSFTAAKNVEYSTEEFDSVAFKPFDDLNLGFFEGNIWIKLEIKNIKNKRNSYMFISNDVFNRNYVIYKLDTIENSLKLVSIIKDKSTKDYRTFNNPNPNLKIDLEANEQATYLITSSSDGRTKDATPKIVSVENYFDFVNQNIVINIFFYGIIFCLLLVNIYQWIIFKQKIYFYYIFYIAFTLIVYLGIEGYLNGLGLKQITTDHIIFVAIKIWALSLIMYTSNFLEIQMVAPRYYKFIKIVLFFVLGGTLLYQFTFYHSSIQHLHYFENLLVMLWLSIIIGMIIVSAKTRRLEFKYYLIPLGCFVAFTLLGVIDVHLQLFKGNSFTYVKIGAIAELIGFTYFMAILIKQKLEKVNTLENDLILTSKQLEEKTKLLSSNKKGIEKTDLIGIFKLLENSLSNESDWEEFKLKFKELNPKFTDKLFENHPDLSKSDIRLLILMKIGYSNKEIANILSIATDSVKKAKSRVRTKLKLPESITLTVFLEQY